MFKLPQPYKYNDPYRDDPRYQPLIPTWTPVTNYDPAARGPGSTSYDLASILTPLLLLGGVVALVGWIVRQW